MLRESEQDTVEQKKTWSTQTLDSSRFFQQTKKNEHIET